MVHFSPSIVQKKQVYNCKANDMSVVYNEQMNHLHVYRRLLTNPSHSKAATLCLASS